MKNNKSALIYTIILLSLISSFNIPLLFNISHVIDIYNYNYKIKNKLLDIYQIIDNIFNEIKNDKHINNYKIELLVNKLNKYYNEYDIKIDKIELLKYNNYTKYRIIIKISDNDNTILIRISFD